MQQSDFDLSNLSDLPPHLRAEVMAFRPPDPRGGKSIYLNLLRSAGRPLTLKEITVGLYRQTGVPRSIKTVALAMRVYRHRGLLVREGDRYRLAKDAA